MISSTAQQIFSAITLNRCSCLNGLGVLKDEELPNCGVEHFEFCESCNDNYFFRDEFLESGEITRKCVLSSEVCEFGTHIEYDYRPMINSGNGQENYDLGNGFIKYQPGALSFGDSSDTMVQKNIV